jgi:hypothetical protein
METPPKPTEANPPQSQEEQPKAKKERTEAQKAATAKALAAMTAARKEKAKKQIEKKEEVKVARKAVTEKILKEDVGFVFKNDFESKISSLTKEIGELRGLLSASKKQDVSAPAPKQERIVERVIERVPSRSTTPTKLTGYELLDKVFFNK